MLFRSKIGKKDFDGNWCRFFDIFSVFRQNRVISRNLNHFQQGKIQMNNLLIICDIISLQFTVFRCKFDLPGVQQNLISSIN